MFKSVVTSATFVDAVRNSFTEEQNAEVMDKLYTAVGVGSRYLNSPAPKAVDIKPESFRQRLNDAVAYGDGGLDITGIGYNTVEDILFARTVVSQASNVIAAKSPIRILATHSEYNTNPDGIQEFYVSSLLELVSILNGMATVGIKDSMESIEVFAIDGSEDGLGFLVYKPVAKISLMPRIEVAYKVELN